MEEDTNSGAVTKFRRRLLTLTERLRGWVEVATYEELRPERQGDTGRTLDVVKGLHRYGIHVRPIGGVQLRIEVAEQLLRLLENMASPE